MKPILEQEQKDIEDLLEEELKKKKSAENFLIGAIEKKKADERAAKAVTKAKGAAVNRSTALVATSKAVHADIRHMIESFKVARETLDNTFKLNDTPESVAEVRRTLASLDLSRHSFSAISLASVANNGKQGEEAFKQISEKTHKGLGPSNKMIPLCEKATIITKDAILAYKNGDPKPLGEILGAGIRNACHQFTTILDRKECIKWSNYLEDVLPAVEKDPELFKASGLSKEELHAANGAVQIGNIYKRGFKALDEMACASIDNTKLTDSRFKELASYVTVMEIASYQRETEMKEWLKKPDEERGQYIDSKVQRYYGAQGVSSKEAHLGVISNEQLAIIKEVSESKSMEKLFKKQQEEAIQQLMAEEMRKTLGQNTFKDIKKAAQQNPTIAKIKEKVKEIEPLKKNDVLLPQEKSLAPSRK